MQNEKWINWNGKILIDDKGTGETWIGRNLAYKQVIVEGKHKLGDVIQVKVTKVTPHYLVGVVL